MDRSGSAGATATGSMDIHKTEPVRTGNVQSVARAFSLLEIIADHAGAMSLSVLAAESGLPIPTIHRLVRTLVDLGYLRQDMNRQYLLAPRLIRLGQSSGAMLSVWAKPHLDHLVHDLGESANLAMLDGDEIVYVAQVQSQRAMRMFTEVGRRVLPHCTAVGKAIMARMEQVEVEALLHRTGMPEHTPNTLTSPEAFSQALEWVSDHGYAVDNEEQEQGVRCVAVAVPDVPTRLGLSVSGPTSRMTDATIEQAVPILRAAAAALSRDLA